MKIGKFEVDSKNLLKVGASVVGIAGMLLSNVVAANDQKKMKDDLKDEIMKELTKKEN